MRIVKFIILILIGFNLKGQVNCNSNVPLLIAYGDSIAYVDIVNDSITESKPTNLALFSQIDLSGHSPISIIYYNDLGDSNIICYSTNIEILKDLANLHSDSEILNDSICQSNQTVGNLIIIENKVNIHRYSYSDECNLIQTNCGIIECDIGRVIKQCKEIQIYKNTEFFDKEQSLFDRIKELSINKNTIIHSHEGGFVKGIIEFKISDIEDKIYTILNDSFWMNIVNKERAITYKSPTKFDNKSEEELDQIGKILKKLVKQDSKNEDLQVISWDKEANYYLVTVEYYDEALKPNNMSSFVVISDSKEYRYELTYVTDKKER